MSEKTDCFDEKDFPVIPEMLASLTPDVLQTFYSDCSFSEAP